MIKEIIVKQVATCNEFGIRINGLKKINFIYGANGCGKTTISKFLQQPNDPLFDKCSIVWDEDSTLKTLTYNKDFRDKNFGKGNIDGVFTLGQATKEQTEEIEKLKQKRSELKEEGLKKRKTLKDLSGKLSELENDFKEEVWIDVYKKFEGDYKEAFKGVLHKENFKNKLIEEFDNNNTILLTNELLKEKASTIFGKVPSTIQSFQNLDTKSIDKIEKDEIWKKKILGKADVNIAKLIQKLNLNDWVNKGREYIQEDETCPFCQQNTISDNFKKQLESYFDESFLNDTKIVKNLSIEYNIQADSISNTLLQIEDSEKSNKDSKLNKASFSAYLKTLLTQFISNKELFNNKIKEPSRSINLVSVVEPIDALQKLIAEANIEIQKHNLIVSNYSDERANLIKAIWKFLVEENKVRIQNFLKHRAGLQRGRDSIQNRLDTLLENYYTVDEEIKRLGKNFTSIQPSIDEINKSLRSYGFQNFIIVPSKSKNNQYQIQREDGSLAESTLSEGEITFITFLYFLQLAKGSTSEENIAEERILVIDDPISSLDSNILFVVSSLLKEIIKSVKKNEGNTKQLILLTHNVYFHKEVSFIDGRTKECNETNYWILRKSNNISSIQHFDIKNPIQNSYELLWMELKNRNNLSPLTIQNTMRRIIENYFKILGKYGDDQLLQQFTDHQEQEICRSMICWINDGSHSIPDDLFIERNDSTLDNYFKVFKNIFVHTKHIEHYNMMMGSYNLN